MKKPIIKSQPDPRKEEESRLQKLKSAPGPGGSQESERIEYHEEASTKPGKKRYDHKPEKNLED